MGGVAMISANMRDDAPSDDYHYDQVEQRGHRQSQDYLQSQSYQQNQEDEALEFVSTNDWWRLLLPNPWLEVRRL
jgi:hypothetical protein